MLIEEIITKTVLEHFPAVQAIYLFGSAGQHLERPDSDLDIALLLPFSATTSGPTLYFTDCHGALEARLGKKVDLLSARHASTVFRKEIIAGELLFCQDAFAREEFEMLALSAYQRLNLERGEILAAFSRTGRAFNV